MPLVVPFTQIFSTAQYSDDVIRLQTLYFVRGVSKYGGRNITTRSTDTSRGAGEMLQLSLITETQLHYVRLAHADEL